MIDEASLRDRALALRRLQGMALREQSGNYACADLVQHEDATFVPGRGSLDPRVAFVIERPSPADARLRSPMTGQVGRLFDELLHRSSVLRAHVYITHLVPWLPPRNRETLTQERDYCLPWLRRELRTVGSPPVVLLGRLLSEYLLVRPYRDLLGEWVFSPGLRAHCLSVRHPAYGMYQRSKIENMASQYRHITDDAKARNEILFPEEDNAAI